MRVLLGTDSRIKIASVQSHLRAAMKACDRALQNTTADTGDVFCIGDEIAHAMAALEPVADGVLEDPSFNGSSLRSIVAKGSVLSAADTLAHDIEYELSTQHPPEQEPLLLDRLLGDVPHGMSEVQSAVAAGHRQSGEAS